ncbi:MAG: hypothetical protein HY904_24445 [Deltaproteobacteria bacterium]|nr:hypothetical protein [Deltaproteobacteria bacterium]
MQAGHQDGSALLGAGVGTTAARCCACGRPFGIEPWWVTHHPQGEHTRCRDWSRHSFPFVRQLTALRRVWRDPAAAPVRAQVAEVGRWLAGLQARWPRDGAEGVLEALHRTRVLRASLLQAGVTARLVNQV